MHAAQMPHYYYCQFVVALAYYIQSTELRLCRSYIIVVIAAMPAATRHVRAAFPSLSHSRYAMLPRLLCCCHADDA